MIGASSTITQDVSEYLKYSGNRKSSEIVSSDSTPPWTAEQRLAIQSARQELARRRSGRMDNTKGRIVGTLTTMAVPPVGLGILLLMAGWVISGFRREK